VIATPPANGPPCSATRSNVPVAALGLFSFGTNVAGDACYHTTGCQMRPPASDEERPQFPPSWGRFPLADAK
jgi:hypothetical protein